MTRLRKAALGFPRLYAAASLKQWIREQLEHDRISFSAALCRGLIEAPGDALAMSGLNGAFSAALCRGLIEARARDELGTRSPATFSAALCRGLIEAPTRRGRPALGQHVFRGFMPRPH